MKMKKYALDDGKKVMEMFDAFSLSLRKTSLEMFRMNNIGLTVAAISYICQMHEKCCLPNFA